MRWDGIETKTRRAIAMLEEVEEEHEEHEEQDARLFRHTWTI